MCPVITPGGADSRVENCVSLIRVGRIVQTPHNKVHLRISPVCEHSAWSLAAPWAGEQEWLSSPVKEYHSIGERALQEPRGRRQQRSICGFICGMMEKWTEKMSFLILRITTCWNRDMTPKVMYEEDWRSGKSWKKGAWRRIQKVCFISAPAVVTSEKSLKSTCLSVQAVPPAGTLTRHSDLWARCSFCQNLTWTQIQNTCQSLGQSEVSSSLLSQSDTDSAGAATQATYAEL